MGVDVQPAGDALAADFSETSPVYAHTETYDSILCFNDRFKYLGVNKDPYFGTTEVGLYLNVNIPDGKTYISFGDDAQLVSSEIILTANNLAQSFVGTSNAQLTYSVFPIVSALDPTKFYYSNSNVSYSSNVVLGAFTGSYTALNGKIVLRIPIEKGFAGALLTNTQYLYSNVAFQNTYKGFYIKCSLNNDEGIIAKFDLEDELSGFYLKYQNGTPSATKADKSFKFLFGGTNPVRFNTVKHNFAGASNSLVQQVVNKDTTAGKDNLFLKGVGVSRVKIYIPALNNYSDSFKVAVNRAEVVLKLDPSFIQGSGYAPPIKLCLLPLDSLNRETFALDQLNTIDAQRYSGKYDETTKQYVFNIARHVQAIFNGKKKNNGFYLVVADADNLLSYNNIYRGVSKQLLLVRRDSYIERVVLAGSSNSALKPVFKLSYIKLKND